MYTASSPYGWYFILCRSCQRSIGLKDAEEKVVESSFWCSLNLTVRPLAVEGRGSSGLGGWAKTGRNGGVTDPRDGDEAVASGEDMMAFIERLVFKRGGKDDGGGCRESLLAVEGLLRGLCFVLELENLGLLGLPDSAAGGVVGGSFFGLKLIPLSPILCSAWKPVMDEARLRRREDDGCFSSSSGGNSRYGGAEYSVENGR